MRASPTQGTGRSLPVAAREATPAIGSGAGARALGGSAAQPDRGDSVPIVRDGLNYTGRHKASAITIGKASPSASCLQKRFARSIFRKSSRPSNPMTISRNIALAIVLKYETERLHIGTIARIFHVHRDTVVRVLNTANAELTERRPRAHRIDPYCSEIDDILRRFPAVTTSQLCRMINEMGYTGSQSHLRTTVYFYRNRGKKVGTGNLQERHRQQWLEWMFLLERGQLPPAKRTDDQTRKELIERLKYAKSLQRRKALVILAHQQLFSNITISRCLGISPHSIRIYLQKFQLGGVASLFEPRKSHQKQDDEALKAAVFLVLHEPPSLSNINRTTWKIDDLRRVLADRGFATCKDVIRQIIHRAGYKWKTARTVLTSNDPDYRDKIGKVKFILSNLGAKDRFFSIDEYGPFAIKLIGGRVLSAPDARPTVPQWQRSKGSLIMTAALDLVENQVVHFFSDAKNTEEMIKMAEVLVDRYQDCRKLYLSWDAASWHISKELTKFIGEYNSIAEYADLPQLESIPLPAGAQFLNVIKSVFSGMARAIIHNSNYPSKAEAAAAINRYFMERNHHFHEHPHRAGDKIWRLERTAATFHPSNNCKDPAYR